MSSLAKLSGNTFMQNFLKWIIRISQYLIGIGSGNGVNESGEYIIFRLLKKICEPQFCIFDVGSNKGQFLDLALDSISTNNFSIHCFEPNKYAFNCLTEREEDKRLHLNNIGIGYKKTTMTLYYDAPGSVYASLSKRQFDRPEKVFNKSEIVQIEPIDNYCRVHKINRINLLKIDIEGHELDALTGAKIMFSSRAIDMVSFEYGRANVDTRTFFLDFWKFFNEANMQLYRITPSGYLDHLKLYNARECEMNTTTIFLAVKNELCHKL